MKGRKFTTVWMLGAFIAGSLLRWRHHPRTALGFCIAGIVVGVSGAIFPQHMRWFERAWLSLTTLLNKIISHSLAFLIFFIFLTPLALLFRILRRDELRLRRPDAPTYWKSHEKTPEVDSYRHLY